VWGLRNLTSQTLTGNGFAVAEGNVIALNQPVEMRLGEHVLHFRGFAEDGPVTQSFRQKTFDLESALHGAILDRLRQAPPSVGGKQEQRSVEQELEAQLKNLRLEKELEAYLCTRALIELMVGRAHGYGARAEAHGKETMSAEAKHNALLRRIEATLELDSERAAPEKAERIEALVPWAIQTHPGLVGPTDRRDLAIGLLRQQMRDQMFGLGPLEALEKVRDINDIMVLPSGQIFIERGGIMQDSGLRMLSPQVSRAVVERIVSREGRRIDHSSPMVDARVADGSRLNAVIEPVAVDGPALTIRRFPSKRLTIDALIDNGTLTKSVADFLRACVIARKSILISGGTGSGKTTLLNELASHVPKSERIITVEDTAEIKLPQTHVVKLQAKPPNMEGDTAVTIRQLVRNALRMRPDRIIVGECRGGEALDMLQAMNTGHEGSMTTIHANSAADAVRRLEVIAMEAEGISLPVRALREQIASALDIIVQVSRIKHRVRRIMSISEVVGMDEESGTVILEDIYEYRRLKSKSAVSQARLVFTGYVPSFFDEILLAGAELACLH